MPHSLRANPLSHSVYQAAASRRALDSAGSWDLGRMLVTRSWYAMMSSQRFKNRSALRRGRPSRCASKSTFRSTSSGEGVGSSTGVGAGIIARFLTIAAPAGGNARVVNGASATEHHLRGSTKNVRRFDANHARQPVNLFEQPFIKERGFRAPNGRTPVRAPVEVAPARRNSCQACIQAHLTAPAQASGGRRTHGVAPFLSLLRDLEPDPSNCPGCDRHSGRGSFFQAVGLSQVPKPGALQRVTGLAVAHSLSLDKAAARTFKSSFIPDRTPQHLHRSPRPSASSSQRRRAAGATH